MNSPKPKTALDTAAERLRAEVFAHETDAFLGNEETLQTLLGVSKPTMRQAARLVEREGLLRVKRGNNGGYFGARPDPAFIEAAMGNYLEVLNAQATEMTTIATVLWIEVVRQAACLNTDASRALITQFRPKVNKLPDSTGFSKLLELELKIRTEVFRVIKSPYMELIFKVNADFSRRHFAPPPSDRDNTPEHLEFVTSWRKTKLMELDAISAGDVEVATLSARRVRELLYRRVWIDPLRK